MTVNLDDMFKMQWNRDTPFSSKKRGQSRLIGTDGKPKEMSCWFRSIRNHEHKK